MRLRDGLAVLWREHGVSQIGTDPRCAVVLDRLTDAEQGLLDRLRAEPTLEDLVRAGRATGVRAARVRAIVGALEHAGVLSPPDVAPAPPTEAGPREPQHPAATRAADIAYWARSSPGGDGWGVLAARDAAVVAVLGVGRLGMLVASGLATAGVGTILLDDDARVLALDVAPGAHRAHHVGRRRAEAGAETLRARTPGTRTSAAPGTRPDVCVLVEHGVANPVRARPLVREDLDHLSVVVGDVDVVVGPFVRPGRGACLRCLDLHRCDVDERWPAVATQIAADPADGVEASLAALGSALAVGQVLAHIDGRATDTLGATLEVSAATPVPVRREWAAHADCGCAAVGSTAVGSTAVGSTAVGSTAVGSTAVGSAAAGRVPGTSGR